jgi:3-hydroxymyristoyl/3-hydroxydecanoyl-(acyl carrier protein) dehydratase
MPPYLLVSRVTALSGRLGRFEPCSVTTEYDVPHGAWYAVDGQAPTAVAVEAGQCDLLLISFLGIDFESRGDRVYRLLDCTLTFRDQLPLEGDTLRYEIRINSFARVGETLLFFFEYDCHVGDRLVLEMRDGCAGFFTDAELAHGRGVVDSRDYVAVRAEAERRSFQAPLRSARRRFGAEELRSLGRGDLAACFGPAHDAGGRNPSLRLPPDAIRMIDRVVDVDPDGGAWGLGLLEAEKDLAPGDWYFPCHFVGDEVLAGSLMADGCSQLLQFYLLHLGLHTRTADARFQPVAGVSQRVVCRGQVTPEARKLVYRMEVTALEDGPRPSARANCDIVVDGRIVVRFTDLALELAEKAPLRTRALYDERQVWEFTLGSVSACFGPEFAVHDGRRVPRTPNGDLQLLTRVVDASPRGPRPQPGAWLESEYDVPDDPWFVRESAYPATPYSVLMEIGLQPCGFLSAHQGTSLLDPDADLYFRNLDGTGRLHREVDLRGRTVRARVELADSTVLSGVILQKFRYGLECGGETFFAGEASFGYFEGAALAEQVGLDGGRRVPPWLAGSGLDPDWVDLGSESPLHRAEAGRPHERLAGPQLRLLDRAAVFAGGGRQGLGYVYAERAVDTTDWFFPCHFHLDPVMPGSLGVEAIVQALQALALETGLTQPFRSPRFGHAPGVETAWKYRGQIVEGASTMAVEAHVTGVHQREDEVVLLAEASLWCDGLRIYEVRDLSLRIAEAATPAERAPRQVARTAAA